MDKKFDYSILRPIPIAIFATILTIVNNFLLTYTGVHSGRYISRFGGLEILILFLVVLPLFFKGYRPYAWSKKGIIILSLSLMINLPITIYFVINYGLL